MRATLCFVLTFAAIGLAFSQPAFAYIGPGAGLTAIGTVLAVAAAAVLAVVGFVWYPVKRALRGRRTAMAAPDPSAADAGRDPRAG